MATRAGGYKPLNYRWFNRLIKWSFGLWLRRAYRVEAVGAELFKDLRPPYVLVSNHLTTRDPFLLSVFVPEPVYWVASDGNMRTRIMRALLRLVGTIPKAKAIPDIETVNLIVEVIRKRRGVVGLFPEGQQSWDGRTLPLFPSTAKLIKLLKAPVVSVVIKGAYFALPRWTWLRRRGKVRIEFSRLFDTPELKRLSAQDIFARLSEALSHDEYAYQEKAQIPFASLRRAEHLELSLFICSHCGAIGSLRSFGNRFHCVACGATKRLDRFGYFRPLSDAEVEFRTIAEWDEWQSATLAELMREALRSGNRHPLFSDAGALLFRGRKMNPLRRIRTGTLVLYSDRIELATLLGERLAFPIDKLEGVGVLRRNLFEFYIGRDLYQFRFPLRSISARKWLAAVEAIKAIPREETSEP